MSSSPAPPPVEDIYGPYLFAALLATAFYSVMCMQTFRYFVHYQKDPLFLKIVVATVWLMNTLHEGMTISTAYKKIIGGLRNPLDCLNGHPEIFFKPLLTALVTVPVQGFFAYRIYIFTKRNFIAPLLWFICGVIQIVATILFCAMGLYVSNGTLQTVSITRIGHNPFRLLQTLIIVPAAALDILIAISMTILLAREWKSPQLPKTSRMLQRLIVFAVNTGVWSAAFALTSLILVYASPTTVFNTIIGTAVCSVYSNTLLANLNARESIGDVGGTKSTSTGTCRFALSELPGPAPDVQPFEESEKRSSAQKVGIDPSEDVWKSSNEIEDV